jgi:hypothetical protein
MNPDPPISQKSPWKSPFLYSSIFLVAIAAYVGFVLLSRYESNRALERRDSENRLEQRRQDDLRAVEQLGGSNLTIRSLYIAPAIIRRGETADLCYGVANAKTVALDPPQGEVWPSHSRCLKLSPRKTTSYTLTITDSSGRTVSQSVELKVR